MWLRINNIHEKKNEIAYHDYVEAKRTSNGKIIHSNPASDTMRSVKTTAYDLNNDIEWNFHIFKAQKIQIPA